MIDSTKKVKCNFCENEIEDNEFYYLYAYVIDSKNQIQYIGANKIAQGLADYLMSKSYHLSATQVLIFRPDIVKEYLQTIVKEGDIVKVCYLKKYAICMECFEEYKEVMPLI